MLSDHPIFRWKSILTGLFLGLLASCGSSRTTVARNDQASSSNSRKLDHIQVVPGQARSSNPLSSKKGDVKPKQPLSESRLEWLDPLLFKYAILLNTEVEQLNNLPLWQFIDRWYGTRYQFGGSSLSGVDCSGFVQQLCAAVFHSELPRTSRAQYQFCHPIEASELREGDLVFFNTSGGVSHVGLYLQNNKFVHASTSSGVMISDLQEAYYRQRWIGAGRIVSTP